LKQEVHSVERGICPSAMFIAETFQHLTLLVVGELTGVTMHPLWD